MYNYIPGTFFCQIAETGNFRKREEKTRRSLKKLSGAAWEICPAAEGGFHVRTISFPELLSAEIRSFFPFFLRF